MATNRRDYVFTHHLRERFVQRTNKKFAHLQQCREEDCELCQKLRQEVKAEVDSNRKDVDAELARRVDEADENRSYLNNTGFMEWYYNKYGFDKRFQFLVHEELLFVVVWDRGKKVIVTCVPSKTHLAGKSHLARKKFSHVPKKEEKQVEQILS